MSATLGKSAGIALLLAVAAMLALLATGVFPGKAGADEHPHIDMLVIDDGLFTGRPDHPLTPAFNSDVTEYTINHPLAATSTGELRIRAANNAVTTTVVSVTVTGMEVSEEDSNNDVNRVDVKLAPESSPTGSESADITGTLIKVTATLNGNERVYNIRVRQAGDVVDKTEATANVRVTLTAKLTANVGDEIVLGLGSFTVPSDISKSDVVIDDGDNSANPRDVSVSGSNVTLVLEKLKSDMGNSANENTLDDEEVTITISTRAGIKLPKKAGTYLVTIDAKGSGDGAGVDARRVVEVVRSLAISPKSAGKGSEVTVTGKGFADGSVTVFRDLGIIDTFESGVDEVLGQPVSANGEFSFATTDLEANSTIQAIDLDGNLGPAGGKAFTLKQSIKATPADVFRGQELTIELVDWGDNEKVTTIRFGGSSATDHNLDVESQDADESGNKIKVNVPTSARLGSLKVEALVGSSSKASKTITVKSQVLTISPTSAVQGQEITIQGSGFGANQRIGQLTFGNLDSVATSSFNAADSNGNINVTVKVPNNLASGEQEIEIIMAANKRSGTAKLSVPKAALTVTPDTGLRGSRVTVTGTGFPASDLIQIKYDRTENDQTTAQPVTTANTDTTGNFSVSFDVPRFAGIGSTQNITADAQLNSDVADVTVSHSTPKPAITLSPDSSAPGRTITISGVNFAGFAPVAELTISDRDVKPVPTPSTDADGSITMTGVLVPQLDPGRYIVTLDIAGETITRFLEITDAPVSTKPADVFKPIEQMLTVVWRYDNTAATWSSYSPTAPAVLNDLAEVSTGTIVWVQVSEAIADFNGQALVAGWNLITLR